MKQNLELSIGAFNLPGRTLGVVDPFAEVYYRLKSSDSWIELGKTEEVLANHDPNFVKKFVFKFDSEEEKNSQITVKFYGKNAVLRKSEFIGKVETSLSELFSHPEKCLDLTLTNESGSADINHGETVAFLSVELINREIRDPVTFKFMFGDDCEFGGFDGKAQSYFVISRELRHSPGQWARVHSSSMIDPPKKKGKIAAGEGETEDTRMTSDVLYANDEKRRLLIELYHYRPKKSKSSTVGGRMFGSRNNTSSSADGSVNGSNALAENRHTLVASVSFFTDVLERIIKLRTPLHFEVEPEGNLKKGELSFDPISFFQLKKGTPKMMIFIVNRMQWYASEAEKDHAMTMYESYIERDIWARLIVPMQEGVTLEKQWKGSSYRGFFNRSAAPMGGGLVRPSTDNASKDNEVTTQLEDTTLSTE